MKKRIPIVAFLMSLFIWGFGQIYNANLKLGFKLFFLFFANNVFAFTLIPFSWPSAIQKLYGIIFVIDLQDTVRIRTGERGEDAI